MYVDIPKNPVPLQSIENIPNNAQTSNPVQRRKRKPNNNDTLANIQVPRYAYNVLAFESAQQRPPSEPNENNAMEVDQNNDESIEIEDITQPIISNAQESLIEEFSSSEEHSPTKRRNTSHLLSQDESLFLNINTQAAREAAIAANAANQPTNAAQITNQIMAAPSRPVQHVAKSKQSTVQNAIQQTPQSSTVTTMPPPEVIYRNPRGDRFEYLYFVNIVRISAKAILVPDIDDRHTDRMDMELNLLYQCNGQKQITITGDGPRKVLKLSVTQWHSVHRILQIIREFVRRMNSDRPTESILHRALYFLFKSTSPFSRVCIEYNDGDLDAVRVLTTNYIRRYVNLEECFDGFVLNNMQRTHQNAAD